MWCLRVIFLCLTVFTAMTLAQESERITSAAKILVQNIKDAIDYDVADVRGGTKKKPDNSEDDYYNDYYDTGNTYYGYKDRYGKCGYFKACVDHYKALFYTYYSTVCYSASPASGDSTPYPYGQGPFGTQGYPSFLHYCNKLNSNCYSRAVELARSPQLDETARRDVHLAIKVAQLDYIQSFLNNTGSSAEIVSIVNRAISELSSELSVLGTQVQEEVRGKGKGCHFPVIITDYS